MNKQVFKYTKQGEYVCKYASLKEASYDANISAKTISKNINNRSPSAGGFIYKLYYSTSKEDIVYTPINTCKITSIYDTLGNIVETFKSRKETYIFLKSSESRVSHSIKNKTKCNGYYISDGNNIVFELNKKSYQRKTICMDLEYSYKNDNCNGKHYLYRHIRLDTGKPFYIGVGTKLNKFNSYKQIYQRALSKHGRNNIWKKIVAKSQYEVEILLESDNYSFVLDQEQEFIKLYGRIDLKTGTLCNLTSGGEFLNTERNLNKKCKTIYVYNRDYHLIKEFNLYKDISKFLETKLSYNSIYKYAVANKKLNGYILSHKTKLN